MNQCFPTAFRWTLLSSGMNARWRQESFVSASLSCPSFKQTGTSKPLQVCLGASAGVQLLSSRTSTCRVVAFHPAQSSCEISISKTPQRVGRAQSSCNTSVKTWACSPAPTEMWNKVAPTCKPSAGETGTEGSLWLTDIYMHTQKVHGSVWIPQFTFLPPKFIQWLERTVGFPPSKKKLIMLNFMAQVRKPLHSLVFVEDSLGRVMERLESGEVEWALCYCQQISSIRCSSCWP